MRKTAHFKGYKNVFQFIKVKPTARKSITSYNTYSNVGVA